MLPLRRPSLKAAASRFEAIASWASTQRACLSPCLSPWPSPWPSNSPRRHPCSGTALAFSDHGGWLVRQRPGRVREGSCHWRATDGRGRAAAPAGLLLPTTHLPGSLAVTPSGPIRNALPEHQAGQRPFTPSTDHRVNTAAWAHTLRGPARAKRAGLVSPCLFLSRHLFFVAFCRYCLDEYGLPVVWLLLAHPFVCSNAPSALLAHETACRIKKVLGGVIETRAAGRLKTSRDWASGPIGARWRRPVVVAEAPETASDDARGALRWLIGLRPWLAGGTRTEKNG